MKSSFVYVGMTSKSILRWRFHLPDVLVYLLCSTDFLRYSSGELVYFTFYLFIFFSSLSSTIKAFSERTFGSSVVSIDVRKMGSMTMFSVRTFSYTAASSVYYEEVHVFSEDLTQLHSAFLHRAGICLLTFSSVFIPSACSASELVGPLRTEVEAV